MCADVIGPNAITFIVSPPTIHCPCSLAQIPAEIFPTRYRCTCHGFSAAAGKLGSVLVQVFVAYARFGNETQTLQNSRHLGYVLLV